jgi:glucokinase-like ROK family protein
MVSVSRATVSGIVSELIGAGLLEEVGEGESTGGRRPIQLQYQPESRLAVGVVLFDNQAQAVVTDMEGNPLNYDEFPLDGVTPDLMLVSMKKAVEHMLEEVPRDRVLGVGVGVPGIVDFETGVLELCVSKGWFAGGIKVREFLEAELALPIYVANRSRVAALGEYQVGVGRGVSNLVYLFLGQGIAVGIVIDGQLYFGSGSSSGEIGHVSIVPDGPLCNCGNHGCLEVYAAEAAIVAQARALAKENPNSLVYQAVRGQLEQLTIEHVIQTAREGDLGALEILSEVGTKVGFAVSTLIDLFNPEMVVLGGPIGCKSGELLRQPIVEEARRRTLARPFKMAKIVSGALGTKAVAIGAAVLAINHTPVDLIIRH